LVVIALGFGVYRRKQVPAWILVGCAVFDVASRIFLGHGGFVMPGILFAFALIALLAMRREAQGPSTQN
jgi:hypothetical protein